MRFSRSLRPTLVLICFCVAGLLAGCTDSMFSDMSSTSQGISSARTQTEAEQEGKLRHPQLKNLAQRAGKHEGETHLFVAYNGYEADGVTPRVLDMYGVTRRVLEEYGVTRRVLEEYGMTNAILQQYGVTSRVLEAFGVTNGYFGTNGITDAVLTSYGVTGRLLEEYGVTNRVLEDYGITARILEEWGNDVTGDLLEAYNVTMDMLEAQGITGRMLEDYGVTSRMLEDYGITARMLEDFGITSRMMEEYGVTSRMLEDYGITARLLEEFVNAFTRTMRLKVRIENGVPGMFISLGTLDLTTFLDEIGADADIAYVELDVPVQGPALASVNDGPYSDELLPWGVEHTGAEGDSAATVEVFVLDSGIYNESNEIHLVEAKDFTALFVNRDVTTWDDSEIINQPYYDPGTTGNPSDETGHGTHVAGTIGARDNTKGVVGMAPSVKIHSLKVLTAQGQTDITTLMAALDYVIAYRLQNPNKPMVVNLSLGMDLGTTAYNVLDEAVHAAIANGITVVVSAGNDGADASTYSPAHVAEAITVGAHDYFNRFASFSNHGPSVDIIAPGVLIPSLSHDPADVAAGYAVVESGTSMAAPHVTGAVARYLSKYPHDTPQQVKTALLANAQAVVWNQPSGTTDLGLWAGPPTESDCTGSNKICSGLGKLKVPSFFQFGITSSGDININDNLHLGIEPGGLARANASVFTNHNLVLQADSLGRVPSVTIQGFGYHAGVATTESLLDAALQPNYNPAGQHAHMVVDSLDIPRFKARTYSRLDGLTYKTKKNVNLKGHYTLGTKNNPTIWYVGGSLSTRGDVTLEGYGIFIVEGGVQLRHNVTSVNASEETTLGIYAEGNIRFAADDLTVAAQVFSDKSIQMKGNSTVYGTLTARGHVSFSGPSTIYYRPASKVLTAPIWPSGF